MRIGAAVILASNTFAVEDREGGGYSWDRTGRNNIPPERGKNVMSGRGERWGESLWVDLMRYLPWSLQMSRLLIFPVRAERTQKVQVCLCVGE